MYSKRYELQMQTEDFCIKNTKMLLCGEIAAVEILQSQNSTKS